MGRRKKLKFRKEYIPLILSGRKRTTIRMKGKYSRGEVVDISDLRGRVHGEAVISGVEVKKFSELDDEDAVRDGFINVEELKDALRDIYRGIGEDSLVYIYHLRFKQRCVRRRRRGRK